MILDGLSVVRRTATVPICVATLLGAGCAGSPLGFKNRTAALTEAPTAEAVAQADATQSGVVTLDSIAKEPSATQGLQQTAAATPTKKPTGLPNFAGIFDAPATTNQQPDPFAVAEAAKPKVAAQALAAPKESRTKVSAGFDATMAELAKGGTTAPKTPETTSERNPFESLADPNKATAKTDSKAITVPEVPSAKELQALLAKELAESAPAPVAKPKKPAANPFADFVYKDEPAKPAAATPAPKEDEAAYVTLDRLGAQKPSASPKASSSSTDWIKEQAASLPAPSSPLDDSKTAAFDTAEVSPASKTRVNQLLDSSERALRAGRYGDAEKIAGQAFDLAETDAVEFGVGERTPSALLRRIASARRSAAKAASPAIDFLTETTPEPAQTATVVPQQANDAFGSFATVTTWQPVSEDGVKFTKPTTTEQPQTGPNDSQPQFTWQASNGSRAGAEFKANHATVDTTPFNQPSVGAPTFQTASLSKPFEGSKEFGESASDIEQTSATATSLSAPQWPETPAASSQPAWAQPYFEQETTADTPALPSLPKLGEPVSPESANFESDLWGDENSQLAMATMEVAPPAPLMMESGDSTAEEPLNYGTLLALLTVIGLGLVAVLAFRTQPESLDA